MKLVIVSNRLPVSVKKENGKLIYHPSIGGLATGLGSYAKNRNNKWVGWPGIASDEITEKERQEIATELRKHNCYPVFLTQKQLDNFYNGYSNSVLWPFFHDREISSEATENIHQYWRAYKKVNELFAEATLALSEPYHHIWVHDYQLLLLPQLLRAERPTDKIGFFLHIPFPKPERFCTMPKWQELTLGMLGGGVVGFHTKSYTENFLDVVAISGIGLAETHKVVLKDRVVRVTDFPIGIDYEKYVASRKSPEVTRELTKLRLAYKGKKIILTVDRLDPSKGLVERAEAYETLLAENPKLRGKVVLYMLVVPSRTEIPEYATLKKDLEKVIRRVNRTYGRTAWKPIHYHYKALSFAKVTALYRRADIAFIAPLKDGMNLVAKEYLASKPEQRGILVLSQTAGAAEQLKEAILVNPLTPGSLVAGLTQALAMPQAEFRRRTKQMQQQIAETNIQNWAGNFIRTLSQDTTLAAHTAGKLTDAKMELIQAAFHGAHRRLLLLDYDGTLAPFRDDPNRSSPSPELYDTLIRLSKLPRTTVVIISGRSKTDLSAWFHKTKLHLVAEHGAFMKAPGQDWESTSPHLHHGWQRAVLPALEKYASKTPDSFVEQKEASLVWHFRKASPYHAQKNLVILRRALKNFADDLDLELRQGNMILEIRPKAIHKGMLVNTWLQNRPDFVLAAGDDYTDEDTFTSLPDTAYTIKVGRGRTVADLRAPSISSLVRFLEDLLT